MEISTIQTKVLTHRFTQLGISRESHTLKITDNLVLNISKVTLDGRTYRVQGNPKTKQLMLHVGCQSYGINQINLALGQLTDTPVEIMDTFLQNRKTGKRVEGTIIESSKNYHILSTGRAYLQSDLLRVAKKVTKKLLTMDRYCIRTTSGMNRVCPLEDKQKLVAILGYFKEIITEVNSLQNEESTKYPVQVQTYRTRSTIN